MNKSTFLFFPDAESRAAALPTGEAAPFTGQSQKAHINAVFSRSASLRGVKCRESLLYVFIFSKIV